MLRMLDCFCGLGGASEGFHVEGFECVGIDIVNVGYPYDFIHGDMNELRGEDFKDFDVVWGSPPCRDFSILTSIGASGWGNGKGKWKIPPSPENGLKLVQSFLRFVDDARPKFYIMENVIGLRKYLDLKPRIINARIKGSKSHVFYGNFPETLIPQTNSVAMNDIKGKLKSWKRAKIPLACSQAFAKACKEALT